MWDKNKPVAGIRQRWGLVAALGAAAGLYLTSPFRLTVVEGRSMPPTLKSGTVCIMDRNAYAGHPLQRGDVVLFPHETEVYVKRVYAVPGDRMSLVRYPDGTYLVPEANELVRLRRLCARGLTPARLVDVTVPAGECFVLGDNAEDSFDSRYFGFVDTRQLLGKVVAPVTGASPDALAQVPPAGRQAAAASVGLFAASQVRRILP